LDILGGDPAILSPAITTPEPATDLVLNGEFLADRNSEFRGVIISAGARATPLPLEVDVGHPSACTHAGRAPIKARPRRIGLPDLDNVTLMKR